ncbi:oxalurate catabolism protein HpxZ [Devosia sp.]|uniref:oxalurate catabolism protein HpxZ n=1 Tax=Devosia sp. TaxID=1871048 RepID=UPI0032667F81
MILNDPAIIAEVLDVFERYEAALLANDSATLDAMFLHRDFTVRYGVNDNQYGIEQIRAFRVVQRPFTRRLDQLVIASYGGDCATASTLFYRDDFPGQIGRQMQTWIRTDTGWRVAAAHVSMMPDPAL